MAENKVNDYIFERTVTHLKLVSVKKMEECKKRQLYIRDKEKRTVSLWELVVEMDFLTKETVDEILESYINQDYANVSKDAPVEEILSKRGESAVLPPTGVRRQDVIFVKTCVSNKLISAFQANDILDKIKEDPSLKSWEIVKAEEIIKPRMVTKVLSKLQEKFPDKFQLKNK